MPPTPRSKETLITLLDQAEYDIEYFVEVIICRQPPKPQPEAPATPASTLSPTQPLDRKQIL